MFFQRSNSGSFPDQVRGQDDREYEHRRSPIRHRGDGPDRIGQDRVRAGTGGTLRRRDRQRRFGAGLSRTRHRRGQAHAAGAGACRTTSSTCARPWQPYSGRRIRRGRAAPSTASSRAEAADPRRRHRAVPPRAAARARRHAGGGRSRSRRDRIRRRSARLGRAACGTRAGRSGSRRARIHATDAQRIQRALEVFRLSGKPISAWQRDAAANACRRRC